MELQNDDLRYNHTRFSPNFVSNQNSFTQFLRPHTNVTQNSFYCPAPDQTLEAAFSSLSLSPEMSFLRLPPDPDFSGERVFSTIQQTGVVSPRTDLSLRGLRFQEGQMGYGVGPRNQAADQGFLMNSTPPPSLFGDQRMVFPGERFPVGVSGSPGLHLSSGLGGLDFLMAKKQSSPYNLNTQFLTQAPSSLENAAYAFDSGDLPQMWSSLSLNDFSGSIVSLAKDQHFSKILKEKLVDPTPQEIEMVLAEIIESIGDLMKNQFGNCFAKKLIGLCNENQRTMIILSLTKSVFQLISICCNSHGTRAMQTLMEHLNRPYQVSMLMVAISPSAAILASDTNGHHVIQYCLKHFSNEHNMHILYNIAANCFEVATNRTGCCVIQSCVEKTVGNPRKRLVSEIIAAALHLAEHPFGNYVLQHMLGQKEPDITTDILRQLEGNYVSVSCNKYGSNVVEKCLIESSEEQRTRIIMELVRSPNAAMILVDPFGNFVIQSALSVAKGHARNALLQLVGANAFFMQSNLYGKKILAWLEKRRIHLVYM